MMKGAMKLLVLVVLVGVGLVGVGLVGSAYILLRQNLNLHVPNGEGRPEDFGLAPDLVVTGPVEQQIAGWYFPLTSPKGGVVIVHGLGLPTGGKANMLAHAQYLTEAGWSVLAIDLYAFGDSPGRQIGLGGQEWQDVVSGYQMLRVQPELKGKPVGLLGISMGGAAVIIAAGKEQVGDFVISAAAYPSIESLLITQLELRGYAKYWSWPTIVASRLLIFPYHNAQDYIGEINKPMLLLHGISDETVPIEAARKLKDKAAGPITWVEWEVGHDIRAEKPDEFRRVVLEFINQVADQY